MNIEDQKYLAVPLPEDIEKRKTAGDFTKALALIDKQLGLSLPRPVEKRLLIEKEILTDLKKEYPFTYDEAFGILKKNIPGFTKEEFDELIDDNFFDWYFIDGAIHFVRHFFSNLLKMGCRTSRRSVVPADPKKNAEAQKRLNDNMAAMKREGGAAFKYRIRSSLKIKAEKERAGENVSVYLPVPAAGSQVRNIAILNHTDCPVIIAPEDCGSRTICFRTPLKRGMEFFVEYSYEIHAPYVLLDPAKASGKQPDFYTGEQAPHILFTPLIRYMYEEIAGDEKNPVLIAEKIYRFVTSKIKYSFVRDYGTFANIPEYALLNRKGDCGVQALLFITLCRFGHIPAKWQSGLYIEPDDIGGHDWAQFYVEPYGWVYADPSFGGSAYRSGDEERRRFYFGNLDPFRMPANTEFEHEFYPPKKFSRQDPTDNQYGECEYDDRGLSKWDYNTKHKLISSAPVKFRR